jgi:hypothetical protein
MYRFLTILPDGTALSVEVSARDVTDAFKQYRRTWWTAETEDVAVYRGGRLVAWVLPAINIDTGEKEPMLRKWK